jgi:3-hydroxymyristoyl/3-hydroxydecanoyl-(acyl carrier protein) dehydratase
VRFVLLDRLVGLEGNERLHGETTFDASEELFLDHFPGRPMVPGTLLTESIAQTGGWLLVLGSGFRAWPILAMVERAKFRRPVRPGTLLALEAWREPGAPLPRPGSTCRVDGVARIGSKTVAEARCVYQLFEPGALGLRGDAHTEWLATTYRRLSGGCPSCPPLPELGSA